MKTRDFSIDVYKGIAIICVVIIHSLIYNYQSSIVTLNNINFIFSISLRQIAAFAVPLFLFVSGYLISDSDIHTFTEYKKYLIPKLKRVLYPYLFWSFILFILYGNSNVVDIIHKLCLGQASGQYYYIILIVQFYVLMPLLRKLNIQYIVFINLLAFLSLYILRFILHENINFPEDAILFVMWITYFYLGIYYRKNRDKFLKIQKYIKPILITTIIMSLIETLLIFHISNNINWSITTIKFSSYLYSIAIILSLLSIKSSITFKENDILVKLGQYSFGIFLIHMLILPKIVKLLTEIQILYLIQPIFQIIAVTTTLLTCTIIISITSKFFDKFNLSNKFVKFIGFS